MIQHDDIPECSICLYAIAPSQALFVAPCAHIFHLKCLLPWIELSFPAFSCPLCRADSDLEAKVEVDEDDDLLGKVPSPVNTFSRNNSSSSSSRAIVEVQQLQQQEQPSSTNQFTPSSEIATTATRPANRRTRSTSSKHFSGFPPLIKRVFSSSVNGLRSIMT